MNLSISPDIVPIFREGIFFGLLIVTVLGALISTLAKRMTRAILGLVVCFIGIAGIYFFLNSHFVALMQLLIYVGAVAITICFAIMLAQPDEVKMAAKTPALAGPFAILLGGAVTWVLASTAMKATWMVPALKENEGTVKQVGESLLTTYSMVFELVSIVLLLAILGALVIARCGRDKIEC
ncbi:MAG: NADH-quinone oxidoreductase subunit J [Desulfurivibrionaceae bacterium]|nr:NADH-quinone oxidoreductase subunit J [Desulfurivibrionaceae bacterium]